ncbi:MAG: WxL domain-containing protein [Homoserinimonas sp.]
MRTITKGIAVAAVSGIMLSVGITAATAEDVTSIISGGDLAATTSGATLTGVVLDGSNTQTATGTATEWTIKDARGTGAAWELSVSATDLKSAAGTVDTTVRTIPVTALTVTPGTVTAGAGSDAATSITASAKALSIASQGLVTATGPNKGTYTLTPSFSLAVPANAYRSNYVDVVGPDAPMHPYITTITYTIA